MWLDIKTTHESFLKYKIADFIMEHLIQQTWERRQTFVLLQSSPTVILIELETAHLEPWPFF